ncbi:GCN5-related N-acetyltransferase 3, chloroplastic isoform X2 [Henckelia pumila]|uniref:GCN5-related N-acetyltransferase 3, chloroplastic isoform X2 n=1 Tax=Henckelia pumila TaxID=405737 RepID=UPI003C6E5008
MAAATAAHGGNLATGLRPSTRRRPPLPLKVTGKVNFNNSPPPIFISTDIAHINPHHLKELYVLCNHSSHRFPNVDAGGGVEPIDLVKLRTAVSHSSVVVSAFTKPEFLTQGSSSGEVVSKFNGIGGDWIRKVTPENGRLIGFGRAVSDCGLTASIYDVMVHPALQGRGIGRMMVQRILRMLTSMGVYDIAALCSDKERLFFGACGFGDDTLKSTTMMYTRTTISPSLDEQAMAAGRKLLIFPPKR